MFDRWLGVKVHHYLQALGLLILAIGLPLNKVLMSIGTIWLAANLIINADFKTYWENWKKSSIFWFVFGFLCLCLIGLIYTSNYHYAFHYINSELPIFVIPIALIAFPIEKKWFPYILYGFLLSLLITSLINFNFIFHHPFANYREYSLFGSHIRYALCIVTGILISIFLYFEYKKWLWLYILLIFWFLFYTYISKVDTGYIAVVTLLIAGFIYALHWIKKKWIRIGVLTTFLFILIGGSVEIVWYLTPSQTNIDFKTLSKRTANGELYHNDTTSNWYENGHLITIYIAKNELQKAWNKRSKVDFNHTMKGGYALSANLIRYMTSKGLTKDKAGMQKMTNADIQHVEDGFVSITQTYGLVRQRLANLKNQLFNYDMGGDPNGNSLLQRFEHWRAAKTIIAHHWIIGVGTGDVQDAFNRTYQKNHTRLKKDNWKRAHNQYLTFWITFGIVGFLFFTGFWIRFLFKTIQYNDLLGIGFTLITIVSFLYEDTMETQEGITFVGLFLGLVAMHLHFQSKNNKI